MASVTGQKTGVVVQAVGQIDIKFAHPRIRPDGREYGNLMYLGGYKLQGEFLNINQFLNSAVMAPILGGGSVLLTNSNSGHRITFSSIRTGAYNRGDKSLKGIDENGYAVDEGGYYDIIALADALKDIPGGDDVGGSFEIGMGFNGTVFKVQMRKCVLETSPVLIANGNDVPTYQVAFLAGRLWTEREDPDVIDIWDEISGGTTGQA